MNFTVEWSAEALNQLADVWMASDDRAGVTAASYRIEATIRADPLGAGESRGDDLQRFVFDPPLAVVYLVYPSEQLAVVAAVGPSRRPR